MRVKRLEIQGFKSFKDKTVIHFDHTITGIVGPNGCGKSNIVDAFFWVMGEQSYKHMRGSSSEDLIFNGSSKYSPLGMAEATMVLETTVVDTMNEPAGATTQDAPVHLKTKETSVTRRLYRSGEGEYLINGNLARLKDIQELFMDTGVGAKGYSVIEQGQIGKIVNAKPEERRLLIEEAAGIAKYKARKKESLRKMEATQANLSRLTDIIQEIERNLDSLERQAQKARLYKKYKDELFAKEITWGRRKTKILHQKLDALGNKKEALEQELAALRAELQTAENSVEVQRIELVTETKEAEELQAKIQDLSHDFSEKRSALDLSRRRQGDLTSQLDALDHEKTQLVTSLESDQERLKELEQQVEEANQLFQSTTVEVKQLSESVYSARKEAETARAHMDSIQRELMFGMTRISDLTSKTAGLLSKADAAKTQVERLTQQETAQNEKLEEIAQELDRLFISRDEFQEQRDVLKTKREEQTYQLQTEEANLKQLEKDRNQSLRAVTEIKSRLQSLEELDQSHEGLADGPKAALDWAKAQNKGHQLHAFTDLLSISEGYELALQGWLENRIEFLITSDSQLTLPLFDKLREGKLGRVGIQLMDTQFSSLVKTEAPATSFKALSQILEKNGIQVRGELSQFVKASQENFKFIQSLFSNVCVIETANSLTAFLKSEDSKALAGWAIVSLDGAALDPQGIFRGGSFSSSGAVGILRRKKTIEELRVQLEEAEQIHDQKEEAVFNCRDEIELLKSQVQSLQTDHQQIEIQFAGISRDIHQTERAQKEAKQHFERLQRDSIELQKEAEKALNDRESIELNLQELSASRHAMEESLGSAEKDVAEKEESYRSQDAVLQSIRVNEASSRERATSLKRELDGIRSLISDRERRLGEIQRIFDRASREQEQFSGGESELAEQIEELTVLLAHTRDRLSEVKDRMEQANALVNRNMERIKELHKSGDQKTSESTRCALDIEKLSGEFSHLIQNLEEKYGPGCLSRPLVSEASSEVSDDGSGNGEEIAAPQELPLEISAEEELKLNDDVERLRERIRRLGEVNVMAIEEFETLKKRYDHILTEKQDLERSLDNLKDAIDHINKTSEDRFKKAFEAIAERFEKLFPVIFGGGQARLSLVYPEGSTDILDAGVDILAQPPGKKVANITLLSGGEKALTAVSLIFAIFMVKPSPFCVLDEVDAPLDDANIGRFNALLKEMSSKSQFILITHNKKTMELNDTLYGVTMEEPGVSKMVSIEMQ
jgi:chromosome segregation protein